MLGCVPHFEEQKGVQGFENTVYVPTTGYWHPGSSLFGLAPSVCSLFGSCRMCVPQFESNVRAKYNLLAPRVVFDWTGTQCVCPILTTQNVCATI